MEGKNLSEIQSADQEDGIRNINNENLQNADIQI